MGSAYRGSCMVDDTSVPCIVFKNNGIVTSVMQFLLYLQYHSLHQPLFQKHVKKTCISKIKFI